MLVQDLGLSNKVQWSNDDYDEVGLDHNCQKVDQKSNKNNYVQDGHNHSQYTVVDLDNTVERKHEHKYELEV